MAQEYIFQVSAGIKGRVTKKLSKEFSRTKSRILGALSKLDEFFSEPTSSDLFRSRSGNVQEQQLRKPATHWDRSLDDPCLEARFSSHHSGSLKSSEVEEYPHNG